jgi:hypothetical protein
MAVHIYSLTDPDTGEVRYVGKANNAEKRIATHMRDARRRNTPVYCWIRSLGGRLPVVSVLEEVPEQEWPEAERRWIASFREGGRLLNLADGGDQPQPTAAQRADSARAAASARQSSPLRRRVWELKRSLGAALRDGSVSESARAKLRMAAQKRPDLFGAWANV